MTRTSRRTTLGWPPARRWGVLLALGAIGTAGAGAQTTVSGEVSGTWGAGGTPYLVIADVTVPRGETLEVGPGVRVVLGEDVAFNVLGQVLAVGDSLAPVVFEGPAEGVRWDRIFVQHSGPTSRFEHVQIRGGRTGLHLKIGPLSADTMATEILDVTFSDHADQAVLGEAEAGTWLRFGGCDVYRPRLSPTVRRSRFERTPRGVVISVPAGRGNCGTGPFDVPAYADPVVTNSVFVGVDSVAIEFRGNSRTGPSAPALYNNVVAYSGTGVRTRAPFDVTVRNNLFYRNGVGVEKTDPSTTLSTQVTHNGFFESDSAHFVGYPATFGSVVMENANGDPTDLAFNLFLAPLFVDTVAFRLTEASPAIDAGHPDSTFYDAFSPPSWRTVTNDMGAWGGPYACPRAVSSERAGPPAAPAWRLLGIAPNPLRWTATLRLDVPYPSSVTVEVYDVLGRAVHRVAVGDVPPSSDRAIPLDLPPLAAGVYVYLVALRGPHGDDVKSGRFIVGR